MNPKWAYVPEDQLPKVLGDLIRVGCVRFEVADNRGGNGKWLVTAFLYTNVGPKDLPVIVKGGWSG